MSLMTKGFPTRTPFKASVTSWSSYLGNWAFNTWTFRGHSRSKLQHLDLSWSWWSLRLSPGHRTWWLQSPWSRDFKSDVLSCLGLPQSVLWLLASVTDCLGYWVEQLTSLDTHVPCKIWGWWGDQQGCSASSGLAGWLGAHSSLDTYKSPFPPGWK